MKGCIGNCGLVRFYTGQYTVKEVVDIEKRSGKLNLSVLNTSMARKSGNKANRIIVYLKKKIL